MKLVPNKLNGIDAMMIANSLAGEWKKKKGEKDTERVKRIYEQMTMLAQTVEVVDFLELAVRLVRDRGNATASFNDLGEYMKQNGYKIVKVSDD